MSPSNGMQIDHINGDPTDNRKCNLRECTQSQNNANSKIRSDNTSGYKGVILDKRAVKKGYRNVWLARIRPQGKLIHIGAFETRKQAYRAYCEKAKEYYGEFFIPSSL